VAPAWKLVLAGAKKYRHPIDDAIVVNTAHAR